MGSNGKNLIKNGSLTKWSRVILLPYWYSEHGQCEPTPLLVWLYPLRGVLWDSTLFGLRLKTSADPFRKHYSFIVFTITINPCSDTSNVLMLFSAMYLCVVCLAGCLYACKSACLHACMSACLHVCMHACMHACMDGWMDGWMDVMYAFLSAGAPDSAQPPGLWPSHADDTEIQLYIYIYIYIDYIFI